jgi:hypothetical protein
MNADTYIVFFRKILEKIRAVIKTGLKTRVGSDKQ